MITLSIVAEFIGLALLAAFGLLILYILLGFLLNGIIIFIFMVVHAVELAYYKVKESKEK